MEKSNEEILEDIMYNLETEEILDIINKPRTIKRDIKNTPRVEENKKYSGRNLKTKIATILLALGIGVGAISVGNAVSYNKGYDKGFDEATSYSDMTNMDIKEEIRDIIIEEYSEATGANKEEIDLEYNQVDSDIGTVEVSDLQNSFKYEIDAGGFNKGNLKAREYRGLISELISNSNEKTSKRELIDLLKRARKFSENKDLVVDGENLKEIDEER